MTAFDDYFDPKDYEEPCEVCGEFDCDDEEHRETVQEARERRKTDVWRPRSV